MKNVDLTKDAVKIIRISFSYIKAIQNELNFFLNISSFKIMEDAKAFTWRKDYSIQITSYIKNYLFFHFDSVPNSIVDELIKIQKKKKNVLWNFTAPKFTHLTTRIYYQNCELTNVDAFFKMISLQCSWLRQLFGNSFH